mmetsp:Transcript_36046/g.58158  ORF Transcript_36046/g.58158 Transcript_36046/m.58158 type:complete len:94 (+) Transcript_36046:751-1032(+)
MPLPRRALQGVAETGFPEGTACGFSKLTGCSLASISGPTPTATDQSRSSLSLDIDLADTGVPWRRPLALRDGDAMQRTCWGEAIWSGDTGKVP